MDLQVYKEDLKKEHFCLTVFETLMDAVEEETSEEYKNFFVGLKKIRSDLREGLPRIYKKYVADISIALKNGLAEKYEYLKEYKLSDVLEYEVFERYFTDLKKLVKEHEDDMNVVLDLISAKDRIESVRVIMLEAEAVIQQFIEV